MLPSNAPLHCVLKGVIVDLIFDGSVIVIVLTVFAFVASVTVTIYLPAEKGELFYVISLLFKYYNQDFS